MNLVIVVLVVMTSLQTGLAGSSPSPDLAKDPRNELLLLTLNPAGRDRSSAGSTTTKGKVQSETFYPLTSTAETSQHPHGSTVPSQNVSVSSTLSSTLTTKGRTRESTFTVSPPIVQESSSKTSTSTSTSHPQSESGSSASTQVTGPHQTSAAGRAPAGPPHQNVPSELNVGDEDLKGSHRRSSSPLDPLLAGLLSIFIVTTAIIFIVLFLKFRQRTNHPEFHRLQDLPMDDLMEDTPLSRYAH